MIENNQLDDKMLLSDCINDITETAINTQIKLVDKYLENYLSDFELKEDNGKEYYEPKKILIKNGNEDKFKISKTTLKNKNHLSMKDFNVSGKFKVVTNGNKFIVDFTNQNGIELDIKINYGKLNIETSDDINNLINELSEGKKF